MPLDVACGLTSPTRSSATNRSLLATPGKLFATFCSTYLDTQVHQLMDASLDKNMIDKIAQHSATAELEKAMCVHILSDLWNAPKSVNANF